MSHRVIIVGAGEAGAELAAELKKLALGPVIVGFVDDEPSKQSAMVAGRPVLGRVDDLGTLIPRHQVDEVIVSAPSAASGALVRRVIAACRERKVRFRIVPRLVEIITGRVEWSQVREIQPEDLLGRPIVSHDLARARSFLSDKTVLVTGAAGSIGSELTRQLVQLGVGGLVLVDWNENGLFSLREELKAKTVTSPVAWEIGSVRDRERLERIFVRHHPSVVFHAAAYKHVPLMEEHPAEAVLNNLGGTRNVAEVAMQYGVADFVMVSTDKAVNPTSVMGCTKRAAEKLIQVLAGRGQTRFVSVRFGNVLGSAGSVIPLFQKQIQTGGPVTVTHAEMIRYFMTIPEAAQLIIQAWALGENGQIFVLDMGEPVRIMDLAEQMIRLHGFEPGRDIEIRVVGLRPGEKLYEETLTAAEKVIATKHEKIFVAREEEQFDPQAYLAAVDELLALATREDTNTAIRSYLHRLVPTYQETSSEAVRAARS